MRPLAAAVLLAVLASVIGPVPAQAVPPDPPPTNQGDAPGNPQAAPDLQATLGRLNETLQPWDRLPFGGKVLSFLLGKDRALRQARRDRKDLQALIDNPSLSPEAKANQYQEKLHSSIEKDLTRLGKPSPPNIKDPKEREQYRKHLGDSINEQPDNPLLQNLNAQDQMKDGDFAGAAASASKAIAGGGGPDSYALRSAANTQLGKYEDAVSDAKEALKADPNNQMAHQSLMLSEGRSRSSSGGGGGSGSAAQGAQVPSATGFKPVYGTIKLTPSNVTQSAELSKRAQSAMTLRDYKSAMSQLTQALELNPENSQAYYMRATAFNQMKLYRQGLADAQAGLALSPNNVPLLNAKAFAQNRLKDYKGAYSTAQQALTFDPRSADAYANMAHALGGMGDRQGMLDNLARASALDPRYRAVMDNLEVQAPTESDALFLFPGEEGFSTAAKPAPPEKIRRSFGVFAIAAIAGGFLIALGLLRALGTGPWQTLRSKLSRMTGSSPAVSDLAIDAVEAEAAPSPLLTPPSRTDGPKRLGGQYEIIREIGEGGMGLVYEAMDRGLQRRVAVKKMRPEIRDDAKERQRFLVEAKTVAALKHPSIVDIFSIVEEDGEVYLIFEFVQGKTLFEVIQNSPLPFPAAVKRFKEVAAALDHAHSCKVIHRDMKPSNIMIDLEGKAHVMDFGVARVAKDALTRVAMTQTVFGTPPYMSPEQEQGVVSPQGDVYSMAICLYESLSKRLPFVGTGAGLLMNKMAMSFKPISELVPGLPPGIDAVFSKAFVYDLSKRYATAGEMIADLERLTPKA
ncbi:MAG: protein kinase [Elusimicrobia bacterium]|nr:protein kinase [Elusimicrobiota bacterium]